MTYQQLISWGKDILKQQQVYDLSFRYMFELCELNHINLYEQKDESCSLEIAAVFKEGIMRLAKDEPLAYVLGFEWFYGRRFIVNEDVLIPRMETEELASEVLMILDQQPDKHWMVFDIACGSGNLAITLDLECTNSRVYASDISERALAVALKNQQQLNSQVTFLSGDMAAPFIEKKLLADVIVCNPPYILENEEVQASVLNYEPHVALFGGQDGLRFYRSLLDDLPLILKEGGYCCFEIGFQQRQALQDEIKKRYPQSEISFVKDINQKDRMCLINFKG